MKAIDFVVRTSTGVTQYGSVSAEGALGAVDAGQGREISLNLRQGDIAGYARQGQDLEITLADGRVVVLSNYFDGTGSRLFISADGFLNEVALSEDVDGTLYAQYGPTEQWGKWSPSDDLIFLADSDVAAPVLAGDEEVSMLGMGLIGGSGLLGAAGAGTAALAASQVIGGGGGSGGGRIPPSVDQSGEITVGGDGADKKIVISGSAEPGSEVEVTIGGGTETATAGPDGDWEVTFEDETFPPDGTHDVDVVVTEPDGTETELGGPTITIDTTPPETLVSDGTVSTGDIVNAEDFADGVEVSGEGEPGSQVAVTVEDTTRETVVGEDGTWQVVFEPGTLPEGEYEVDVTIVATDGAGNTTTITDRIAIDTVPNALGIDTDTIEGDGVVNGAERADGIELTGTATPGASVIVGLEGHEMTVIAGADGIWNAVFDAATLPDGQYEAQVTARSTDGAGNASSTSGTISVDTSVQNFAVTSRAGGADGVINAAEAAEGLSVSGTTEPGSTVTVTLGGQTVQAVVAPNGTWTAAFAASQIPAGTYATDLVATATDVAGNVSTLTRGVSVDTEANAISINSGAVGGDGVVNGVEAAALVNVTGTATPGAQVVVTLQGVERTVIAGGDGAWTAGFAAHTLPQGQYEAQITARSTDAAGNVNSTSGTVHVDTSVQNFAMTSQAGGADGVINAAEAASGLSVSGTTEPGSTVSVRLAGQTVQANVRADGTWTAAFTAAQIPAGTYSADLLATATDAAGNVRTLTHSVDVDTDAGLLTLNAGSIGGDGVINAAEAARGVQVTGTADPGATVTVELDGVPHIAVAGANGVWRTTYGQHEITPGEHDPQVRATVTDAAGNSRSVEGQVHVDTQVDNLNMRPPHIATGTDGGDVINGAVAASGFDVTGTIEPGSRVTVTIGGVARQAVVDANGDWTARFLPGDIRAGEYNADLRVDVTDPAGNTSSLSDTVRVDTGVNALSRSSQPVEGDNVINALEARDGVTLSGQVERGSTVEVDVFGRTYIANVAANGTWTVQIPGADIPEAAQDFPMVVRATDAAGNPDSFTDSLTVDTTVPDQPEIVGYFREGGGYRSATVETTDDAISIHQVAASGQVTQMALHASADPFLGETDYHFLNGAGAPTRIPDGSQLIVTASDAAGNASSTYVVLDETSTSVVNIANPNLQGFQIEAVDLRFGDQSQLTVTEAQVRGLSDVSDTLVVHGGSDDTVTILGAQTRGNVDVNGESHTVYTLGDSATVIVDDDIHVIT